MKSLKVNMDMVNCGLLLVILVLVVMCGVKREGFRSRSRSRHPKIQERKFIPEYHSSGSAKRDEIRKDKLKKRQSRGQRKG